MAKNQTVTHGEHQKLHIRPFQTSNIGILSGTIEYHIKELFDAPQWSLLRLSQGIVFGNQANIPGGLSCSGAERKYDPENQMAIYTYTYEGLQGGGTDPLPDPTFELDITMQQEPLETHPSFEVIARDYHWHWQTKEFARNIPKSATKPGLSTPNDPRKGATNPMYGISSYMVPGVIYRKSYAARLIPVGLLDSIGMIVIPPGLGANFPELVNILKGTNRNWLKLSPKIRQRGRSVEVTEEYLLSGPRGVNSIIYNKEALRQ